MPGLLAAMDREYPAGGLRSNPYVEAGPRHWTGPRDENEAASWLSGQDRGWAFGSFSSDGLPLIMLVHDLDNPASCRVAEKSGYEFSEISPANPPLWYAAGHVHVAVSRPGMPMPASLLRGGG